MKKWQIRLILGATGLLAILVVAVVVEWYRGREAGLARRNAAAAKLDAEDPTWRLTQLYAERNAALPPPEQNAGVVVVRAVGLLEMGYIPWLYPGASLLGKGPVSNHLPQEGTVARVKVALEGTRPAIELARTARKFPKGGFPRNVDASTPPADTSDKSVAVRAGAALLREDALANACDGRGNDALESSATILHCAKIIGDEPTLLSHLACLGTTSTAKESIEQLLAWTEPTSDEALGQVQKACADELAEPRLTQLLRAERAALWSRLQDFDDGTTPFSGLKTLLPGEEAGPGGLSDHVLAVFYRRILPDKQATVADLFREMLDADKLPGVTRQAKFDEIASRCPARDDSVFFGASMLLDVRAHVRHHDRVRAQMTTAVAALACERYRLKTGYWPSDLAEIPKDILATIPTDPYTGGPLVYKKLPDGLMIYTTGPDLHDDGGIVLRNLEAPGNDIGFRLWNPDQRRQPPLPVPHDRRRHHGQRM
ncbi:hypothetical protein [Fimbriiglobus ruber]|uniref:Uncharacterized protein n=1 Tax=Fimbriiglobus ruber TaxID=1908690 RepID=A0A225CZM3_9BACT|nr:hypothetical protein [Fimbriiglobus ruber]OWK34791.1 hypothetical protein FRUB_09633 [Fimbriiglobus ruber]